MKSSSKNRETDLSYFKSRLFPHGSSKMSRSVLKHIYKPEILYLYKKSQNHWNLCGIPTFLVTFSVLSRFFIRFLIIKGSIFYRKGKILKIMPKKNLI